jgi:predicted Zn-dependent peptidase
VNGLKGNTNKVAVQTLFSKLFMSGDANYRHDAENLSNAVSRCRYADVVKEHESLLNSGIIKFSVLGPENVRTPSLNTSPNVMEYVPKLVGGKGAETRVYLPGKTSCTVLMGMVLPASPANKVDYSTLVAVNALGNGFSGRLMSYIRDVLGLSYGLYASVSRLHGCTLLQVTATFSPTLLERGLKEMNKMLDSWFQGDLKENEVETQKNMLIGGRNVSYDSASNVLAALHNSTVIGRSTEVMDNFDEEVSRVTLESSVAAVRKLERRNLHTVVVGSFNK